MEKRVIVEEKWMRAFGCGGSIKDVKNTRGPSLHSYNKGTQRGKGKCMMFYHDLYFLFQKTRVSFGGKVILTSCWSFITEENPNRDVPPSPPMESNTNLLKVRTRIRIDELAKCFKQSGDPSDTNSTASRLI